MVFRTTRTWRNHATGALENNNRSHEHGRASEAEYRDQHAEYLCVGKRRAHSELEATLSGENRPQQQRLAATKGLHLQLQVYLAGARATALLDTVATGNFINPKFMEKHRIASREKPKPYGLGSFGNNPIISKVDRETHQLRLQIREHQEEVCFDVTDLGNYDLVLGFPWFEKHNPDIDWQKGTLQQMRCDCPSKPEVQQLCASHHEKRAGDYTTNQDGLNEPEIREKRQVPQREKRSIEQLQGHGD